MSAWQTARLRYSAGTNSRSPPIPDCRVCGGLSAQDRSTNACLGFSGGCMVSFRVLHLCGLLDEENGNVAADGVIPADPLSDSELEDRELEPGFAAVCGGSNLASARLAPESHRGQTYYAVQPLTVFWCHGLSLALLQFPRGRRPRSALQASVPSRDPTSAMA